MLCAFFAAKYLINWLLKQQFGNYPSLNTRNVKDTSDKSVCHVNCLCYVARVALLSRRPSLPFGWYSLHLPMKDGQAELTGQVTLRKIPASLVEPRHGHPSQYLPAERCDQRLYQHAKLPSMYNNCFINLQIDLRHLK